MEGDQFTKQVRHDLQNARKTTARWITGPNGSGRPQPRETKESAHQSHPTPATPAVRKQTSEQPRIPAETTNETAKPAPPVSASSAAHFWPWLLPRDEQKPKPQKTSARQSPAPGPQAWLCQATEAQGRSALPASCLDQNCTIKRRYPTVGCTVRVQRTHKSGIHGQLCTCKQRQTVCDHLEPSVVHHVKVPHKQISGDSATDLSADLRSCALKGKTPSPNTPTRLQAARWWP